MRNKLKVFLVLFLVLCAVFSSAFAISGASRAENKLISTQAVGSENNYVLRDYEGYVAVFIENDPYRPMTVTDIPVSTLREMDRQLMQTGLKVKTHESLVVMLEDLGS